MTASARRVGQAVLAVAGIALVIYFVRGAGPERVARVLWEAGSWLPVVVGLEIAQLASDVVAIRFVLRGRGASVPATAWVRSSSTAYAMMVLLPAGRAAGEVARATILSPYAGAARVTSAGAQLHASYLFANAILSASACAAVCAWLGPGSLLAVLLAGNTLLMAALASALLAVLWDGRVGRWMSRQRLRFVSGEADPPAPSEVDARRALPWRSALVCSAARAVQVVQYGVVLRAVGGGFSLRGAFTVHGIHLVGSTLGDVVPNQAGVLDGTYRAFAADMGFGGAPSRALSIAFLVRIAQLLLAGACIAVAALTKRADRMGRGATASASAGARS